ncbi:hypothetical protein SO802_029139 [Lithocarpus litseifolius]|uniref:RNase H type-1 domain-containing protein n=1 Tax=Lithocarpus litseifolius TaxID=425828 RepID=A0AAW2BVG1_9ROSI
MRGGLLDLISIWVLGKEKGKEIEKKREGYRSCSVYWLSLRLKERQRLRNRFLYREYGAAVELTDPVGPVTECPVVWTPPRNGWFKVNVDGAIFSKQKNAGIGVLIRDDLGRVEVALSRKVDAPLGAVALEAKAFEAGLLFARDIGLHDVVLEGDSLILINALRGTSSPPSSVEHPHRHLLWNQ